MKIGIISSGNETLALRKILTKYNHEYLVYHDQTFFPFGSKDFEFMLKEIQKAVQFLKEQGAEVILLDPVYELALAADEPTLLPLFTTYLQKYVFKYSLVGKIGIVTDIGSSNEVQKLLCNVEQGNLST
ncbi:MAG: hypothetical protein LBD75_06675 [Candidatus Peribacteria bacterium]|jgi:hypothetical protein|nr:hypothetical protein [Candidatus Peribacteria bacterium]